MATSLERKLQLRPGVALSVLNAPDGVAERLRTELGRRVMEQDGDSEAALLFLNDLGEVRERVPPVLERIAAGGPVWIAYPRKSSGTKTDVDRDTLWAAVVEMGWAPVRQIAVDEKWSAVRFRPQADVGT